MREVYCERCRGWFSSNEENPRHDCKRWEALDQWGHYVLSLGRWDDEFPIARVFWGSEPAIVAERVVKHLVDAGEVAETCEVWVRACAPPHEWVCVRVRVEIDLFEEPEPDDFEISVSAERIELNRRPPRWGGNKFALEATA